MDRPEQQSQSQSQSQPQQPQQQPQQNRPAQRDMMYCHECHDEWYRDEHGLTCPECGSEFTEIIEAEHDPRADEVMFDGHEDDDESMPDLERPHGQHPLHQHNPWGGSPESDGPINFQFRQTPGGIAITSTFYRSISPEEIGSGHTHHAHNHPVMEGFAAMLNSIAGLGRPGAQQRQEGGQGQGQNQGPAQGEQGAQPTEGQATPGTSAGSGSGTMPGGHRFTYTSSARLSGGPEGPGVHIGPGDDPIEILLGQLLRAGGPPQGHHQHGAPVPLNPLAAIFANIGMPGFIPGGAAPGDFVYSQEALDRIISQMMEQNATGNAPGPAKQEDIAKLTKKPVDIEMLGPEGHAECSICMEEVNIGEEVTQLPCRHWFHGQCVTMWLSEHDTCPHCRQGISKHDAPQDPQDPSNQGNTGAGSSAPGHQMPGSFGISGEGTTENPFLVADTPEQNGQGSSNIEQQNQPSSSGEHHQGGLGARLRNLFGSD
ncbi:hypothetical protein GQ43DRAFT_436762 [Delitschia confertaspora ATCC 74209]|uniref:RING-type E3 ubiquitin transferase n=1 Tax=Delitschia confertaspora ATCC 74209 TaxID=1513339 RepID=A0A9P4N3F7_9PLEO|nr:hypothetical protein GQ43DRAFT_436762 [Delitschia confertaspora ATCC 74209]